MENFNGWCCNTDDYRTFNLAKLQTKRIFFKKGPLIKLCVNKTCRYRLGISNIQMKDSLPLTVCD